MSPKPIAAEVLRRLPPRPRQRRSELVALLCLLPLAALGQSAPTVVPPAARCPGLPEYPASERLSGKSGKVVIKVVLDEQGTASELSVATSLGQPFDEAALEATRKCTFTAATSDGKAVPAAIELTVDFVAPPLPATLVGDVSGDLGEPLAGAAVTAGERGALTDEKGHFEVPFDPPPSAELWVVVAKAGYEDVAVPARLLPGEVVHAKYQLARRRGGGESTVRGTRELPELPKIDRTPQVSRFQVTKADIDRTPGALEDISRVIHDLPGVAADPDLLATFFVRGGGPSEVVYYLDGVPLANPFHLGGFLTLYNPMLIDSAEFFSGGVPSRYEPSLSGVLEVKYATGETSRPRVWADVSMHTAKARLDTPTGVEGLSVMLSARRSYFELYFAGLKALKVVGQNYVAPDITEYLGRAHYRRGRHQVLATVLHSSDGLNFMVSPGEQVMVDFAGNLSLSNVVQMAILQDRIDLGGKSELSFTGALTRDESHVKVAGSTVYARDSTRQEAMARGDLTLATSEQNRFQLGLQYARRFYDFSGQVSDTRSLPPWYETPIVDLGLEQVDIHPTGLRDVLAAYVEDTWRPLDKWTLEGGLRVQADLASAQSTYSMRAATSYELPTLTVAKLSFGMATQFPPNPLVVDPSFGNPNLAPERSTQLVAGLEQPLPIRALLRVEAFQKWLDHLTANPDTVQGAQELMAANAPVFQAVGSGQARGVDALLLGRLESVFYGLSLGLVWSDRTNPLAEGRQDYPAPWDQRFTASAHVSYVPWPSWIISGRGSFHTGRPYTPVVGFRRDEERQAYLPVFGPTNSARYPNFYELSLRLEKRFAYGALSMAWYAEVINVTNAQNLFATVYDRGNFAEGQEPSSGAFNHLPFRPFLGIRGEY